MREFYILLSALLISLTSYSQITCANAQTITTGITTVPDIISGQVPNPDCAENFGQLRTGGRWFVFTASVTGVAKVSSDLSTNATIDTRLHIYTGSCSALQCVAGNDDKDPFGNIRFSEVIWPITSGTSYYIAWDNQWDTDSFDFELTESVVSCPNGNAPIASDFDSVNEFIACFSNEDVDNNGSSWKLQSIDINGNGTEEDYATNGTNSNNAKDDWMFSPAINIATGNQYTFNFKYNGGNGTFPANENLNVYLVDAPTASANILETIHTETGIVRTGTFAQAEELATVQNISYIATATGSYYLAFNGTSPANSGSLLLFDFSVTEETLSTEDVNINNIAYSYNSVYDLLTIETTSLGLASFKITNLLGQQLLKKSLSNQQEHIELSSLKDGVYILEIKSNDQLRVVKFLKY